MTTGREVALSSAGRGVHGLSFAQGPTARHGHTDGSVTLPARLVGGELVAYVRLGRTGSSRACACTGGPLEQHEC